MKISVIVPVYNVEKYIGKCLDSLVNQTLEDIEIIIVNDGSPDNSQKIINKYVKKYPQKVKSFIKENGGQGSARNYGLKHAKGEYVAYVDSDDWVELDMFEKMYNLAKKDKSDIVICGNKVVSMDNKIIKVESATTFNHTDLNIIFGKMAVWNKIYNRKVLINARVSFRNKVWYEDIDFTMKMLLNDHKISFINEPLYNYLLRPGSTMNNSNINKNLEILDAFDETIRHFKKIDNYDNIYDKIEFIAIYHIYIFTIVRVINAKSHNKMKLPVINSINKYMKDNFPNFRKNRYIKHMDRNKKIIYFLINTKMYWLIKLIFKIKSR